MNTNISFKITGMHCNSCAMLIKGELEDLTGVSLVEVDFKSGKGSAIIDNKVSTSENIIKIVQDLGYQIKLEEEDE